MNKIMLIGNVGKEPDMRYYDADQALATFPLATTERGYTLSNGTQVPDRTDWHNIILWRGLAKIAEKYIHKGDKIYVEGKMQYRTYNDKNGQQRFVAEVIGESLELLSPKPNANSQSANQGGASSQQTASQSQMAGSTPGNDHETTDGDSAIPF